MNFISLVSAKLRSSSDNIVRLDGRTLSPILSRNIAKPYTITRHTSSKHTLIPIFQVETLSILRKNRILSIYMDKI